ncbi:MAG: hypothetical protein GY832_35770 [Chloroflexi bacterium]|nr:hypothetical protein [Chloroflexota bacterium]
MIPVFEMIAALFALLTLLALIIVIETIVLRLFKYGSLWRSLLTSLGMNVASTVIAFTIGAILGTNHFWGSVLSPSEFTGLVQLKSGPLSGHRIPAALFSLLIWWVVSVISEGGILMLGEDIESRRTWEMTLIANTASYVLLFGLYINTIL